MEKKINIKSLKRFQNWMSKWNNPSLGLWDYAAYNSNPDLLLSIISILYPNTIEYENCIILEKSFDKENFASWKKESYTNTQIECVLNHLHIYDLFNNQEEGEEEHCLENLEYLGKIIIKFWKVALTDKYPNKTFEFVFSNEGNDYGPTIYFFQK